MRRFFPLLVLALTLGPLVLGCGHAGFATRPAAAPSADLAFQPLGPGTVFPSIEVAVVDALAYAHLQAQASPKSWVMRGGAITEVAGGYTHAEPLVANRVSSNRLRISLGPDDVAHYKIYPRRRDPAVNRANEVHSEIDRTSVALDPRQRPSFILTPSLKVKVYHPSIDKDVEIARLIDASMRSPRRLIASK